MIKKLLKLVWNEFIYGGHLQSLGAAGIVFVSGILLGIRITWDILFITYLIFYVVYLYDRSREIGKDQATNPERSRHLQSYSRSITAILSAGVIILMISLICFANFWASIFALLLVIFGLLYTKLFKRLTKKIALFKNFYVANFFSVLIFFPIVYYSPSVTSSLITGALALLVLIYFKSIVMQIALDLKDAATDKGEGLLTLAVMIGKEKTLRVLKAASILSVAPILLSVFIFPKSILMLLLIIPFNFYCFKLIEKQNYFGYILISGEFLLWAILITISKGIL